MAPRGVKRAGAAHAAESPMKKPARAGSLQRKFDMIAEALEGYDGLPQDCLDMLVNVIGTSVGTKQDHRHGFQEQVVSMLESALQGVEAGIHANIRAEVGTVQDGEAEKANREAKKSMAEGTHTAKVAEVAQKASSLEEAVAAHGSAKDALKEAKAAQKSGDKELEDASKNKEKIEGTVKDQYEPLKGELKPAQRKAVLKTLLNFLKKIGFDASIADATQVALQSNPDARTSFDQLVLTQVDAELSRRVAAYEATLAEGAPAKEAREQAVATTTAAVEAAEARRDAAIDTHNTAESEEVSLKMSLNEAIAALDEHASEVEAAGLAADAAKDRLSEFQEGPLAAFKELKERSTPPPVVEEEAAAPTEMDSSVQATL